MPTREQTNNEAIKLFQSLVESDNPELSSTWLGIYQVLLWFEPVNWLGFGLLPHIIDADKLRPNSPRKQLSWSNPTIWQRRAQWVSDYLGNKLGCAVDELPDKTDLLMKKPDYQGLQRQNILGIAFSGLIKYVLEEFGAPNINYTYEVEATRVFPGIAFPGRSSTPRIDILAEREGLPLMIISAKWSLRHDRLSDITNECPVYKASYQRIYRTNERPELKYFVATNEFDPARLNKILDDSCVNGVVHVHKPAVTEVCQLDGRLDELIDLEDFVKQTYN